MRSKRNSSRTRPLSLLLVILYIILTFPVLPFMSLAANFDCCGAPSRSLSEALVGMITYWVLPVLLGIWLIRETMRRQIGKIKRVILIVLAVINISWPIGFKIYYGIMVAMSAQQYAREQEKEQQLEAENKKMIAEEKRLEAAAATKGCGGRPQLNTGDYSQRIAYYLSEIETKRGYYSYIHQLLNIKTEAWKDCANGKIDLAEQAQRYNSIPTVVVNKYKELFGDEVFRNAEGLFRTAQDQNPSLRIY